MSESDLDRALMVVWLELVEPVMISGLEVDLAVWLGDPCSDPWESDTYLSLLGQFRSRDFEKLFLFLEPSWPILDFLEDDLVNSVISLEEADSSSPLSSGSTDNLLRYLDVYSSAG